MMKKLAKYLVCILMAVMLLFSFAACGTTKPNDPDGPDNPKPIQPDKPDNPDNPDTPDNPDNPDVPTKPDNPTIPDGKIPADQIVEFDIPDGTGIEEFGLPKELPRINIMTESGENVDGWGGNQPYYTSYISVSNCREGQELENVLADVRVRGNNTASYPKKPYRIKFNKKQSLLGLNDGQKYKSWCLLADYKDFSFMRNSVVFELAKQMYDEDGYFASDFCWAEVYMNGKYNGVYLVAEQQQVNEGRVDIVEPADGYEGTDIGYFIEFDGSASYSEDPGFWYYINTKNLQCEDGSWVNVDVNSYTIKSDIYGADITNTAQKNFIQSYTQNIFNIIYDALYNGKYTTFNKDYTKVVDSTFTNSRDTIAAVVDIRSWVDMYLLQEIACDNDLDWASFYLSVDMSAKGNKKLTFQAPWDFDSGFGFMDRLERLDKIFAGNHCTTVPADSVNPWMALPMRADWFMEEVAERWNELKEQGAFEKIVRFTDVVTETYTPYFNRNYTRWDNLGKEVDGFYQSRVSLQFKSHNDAYVFLRDWITHRIEFLDEYFNNVLKIKTAKTAVIKTLPSKTEYMTGEAFNAAGTVLSVTYEDGTTADISVGGNSNYIKISPSVVGAGDTHVEIVYGACAPVTVPITVVNGILLEAENAAISGQHNVDSSDSDASGGLHLSGMNSDTVITFSFNSDVAGTGDLVFRMASQYLKRSNGWDPIEMGDCMLNKICDIYVNDSLLTVSDDVIIPGSGSDNTYSDSSLWVRWADVKVENITLEKGANTVTVDFKRHDYYCPDQTSHSYTFAANTDYLKVLSDDCTFSTANMAVEITPVRASLDNMGDELYYVVEGEVVYSGYTSDSVKSKIYFQLMQKGGGMTFLDADSQRETTVTGNRFTVRVLVSAMSEYGANGYVTRFGRMNDKNTHPVDLILDEQNVDETPITFGEYTYRLVAKPADAGFYGCVSLMIE